jgi:hypothetical protein
VAPAWLVAADVVGLLLPFELALLFVLPELVMYILLGVLLTPPFMATFTAATVNESNPRRATPTACRRSSRRVR